ncbi:hypothetical protein GCM10023238_34300 [Streptomyces heliomycini]
MDAGRGLLGVLAVRRSARRRARSLPGIVLLLACGPDGPAHALRPGTARRTRTGASSALSDATLVEQAARLLCGTTAAGLSPAQAERVLIEARVPPTATATHNG